ncbi:SNF2 family N-terminal domain-containing protein [Entophlyctis helioformis]|nr:SNF2 family N-terminal domain-containing protein [Entophlyctis helioformis]
MAGSLTNQPLPLPLQSADAQKRYAYLLGQTDIFAHFLNISKMKSSDANKFRDFNADVTKSPTDGSRRHRKTEKEEDEELLRKEETEDDGPEPFAFTESPKYVEGGIMRDYQIQGLNWLVSLYTNGINGILADEMGLGKTLQSISFLGYLKHMQQNTGPHVVIVPKSTLHNWYSEFRRWVPSINVFMFHGNKDERAAMIRDKLLPVDFEVVVTSYEMCLLEKSSFKRISWQYIVIDEAHRIKNENSALSQIVRLFNCRNRLLLTGTPLQNNLHELWALLNFLLPDVFSSSEDFDNWFNTEQGGDQDQVVNQLHKVLRPFLLRRIKSDVEKSLLPKKRINLYVGMSSMQRKWYQKILEKDIDAVNGAIGKKESKTRLQNIVMQLRKCCNHPYLFDGAEPGPPYTTDQHIVDNAGKMVLLDKLLQRLKAQGSRVLLFSQMSRVLDILEDYCAWKGYDYCRLDGTTAHDVRVTSIDEFNKPDSTKFIFLLTTRAGGLGINLATADTVVMYDNDWNPQVVTEDRAHRIGQKKQVVIFRFITENAIEEKVIDRATQKLRLDQLVIQQGRAAQPGKASSKEDLVAMIQHGADNIFKSVDSTISQDDIEEILKRSEKKTAELDSKYKDMGLDDLQKFTIAETSSAYQWEGEDFRGKQTVGMNWIGPSKRERKANYDVDSYYRNVSLVATRTTTTRPPKPKTVNTQDFQFYPRKLTELQEKEKYAFWKAAGYKPSKSDCPETDDARATKWLQDEEARIAAAEPLTEAELSEKEALIQQGFENWTKRDFQAFCKASEKHGRGNLEAISREVEGKTLDDVEKYAPVFWTRLTEISDHEKIVANVERGEARLRKIQETADMIAAKVAKYRMPLQQLKMVYGQNKGKNYTEEEDRFLLVALDKFGYGSDDVYEKIRNEIRKSPMFRFDWFIKSRTTAEIMRRCNTIVMLITKELEAEEGENGKRKANQDPKLQTTTTKKRK